MGNRTRPLIETPDLRHLRESMPFEAIYRAHFESIWRAVQRFGVAPRDAADAAQEVFVIAHRRWPEFEGRAQVRTWLFGIAFRVAAGRRRRAASSREVLTQSGELETLAEELDPEQASANGELRRLLERALAALPLEQRAVFTLFELEGFGGEEIARILELPEGTVRSRLRLARATFSRVVRAELGTSQAIAVPLVQEATHD